MYFFYREYEEPFDIPSLYPVRPGHIPEDEVLVQVKDPIDAAWEYFGDDIPREIFNEDRR